MMEKCKVNIYGDIATIDVEREHATQLADYLVGMNCEVTEVRLQHATNTGKIIIKLNDLIDEDLIELFCKLYFINHEKKGRAIGDKFRLRGCDYIVEEAHDNWPCILCAFGFWRNEGNNICIKCTAESVTGECGAEARSDRKDVYFRRVE